MTPVSDMKVSAYQNVRRLRTVPTSNVRYGSLADIRARTRGVRFTPNSGRAVSPLKESARGDGLRLPKSSSATQREGINSSQKIR